MHPQGTLLILDIGSNTIAPDCTKSFFQRSRECITRIIERKIMRSTNELIGIILMGSSTAKSTSNPVKYVEILSELENPSWNMIQSLPNKPTKNSSDWFEALIYSSNYFINKNNSLKKKLNNKRIVLFTNFLKPTDVCESAIEKGLKELLKEDFQIDVIGYDINSEKFMITDTKLIRKIVQITNGMSDTFDCAMKEFLFYNKKYTAGSVWNVDLCIGKIKIPISTYLKVKTIKSNDFLKEWKYAARDPVTGKASNLYTVKKQTLYYDEDKRAVNSEKVTEGYHYGQSIIPFSALEKSFIYKSGPISLNLYGFTAASNLKLEMLNHNSLSYVHGRIGCKNAKYAIKCLAQCLLDEKLVCIARGVRRTNCAPRMFALMPVKEEKLICLSMVGVCFKEEIKYMPFPETECKKFNCSNEQVDGFKDLIKNMDLSNNNIVLDGDEMFKVAEIPCPTVQHIYDSIVHRAKSPGEPLPGPKTDIMKLFQVPPPIENNIANSLKNLKSLFTLNEVINRDNKVSTNDTHIMKVDKFVTDCNSKEEDCQTVSKIYNVGTIDPVNDYKLCLKSGKPLNIIKQEMGDVIEILMHSNLDEHHSKGLEAMSFFRMEGVKSDPSFYNNWLNHLKIELACRERNDLIDLIKVNNIDYILNGENKLSELINSDITEMLSNDYYEEININTEAENIFDSI